MIPTRFPNGSRAVATWMPSPTSWGALAPPEPALRVGRPARAQHAGAELRAHAVEGAIERRAAARLALGEQVALLAAAAHEVRERHAQGMERHAPRELAPQQLERQQQ